MIRSYTPPDCFKSPVFYRHDYFELVDQKGPYGYLAIKINDGVGAVHLQITRWSHKTMRTLFNRDFPFFKAYCRKAGVKKIYASSCDCSRTWARFIKMFGFSDPETIAVSSMEV